MPKFFWEILECRKGRFCLIKNGQVSMLKNCQKGDGLSQFCIFHRLTFWHRSVAAIFKQVDGKMNRSTTRWF